MVMERIEDLGTVELGVASEETKGGLVGIREPGGKDFAGSGISDDD
jgi:hypothetical protein